MRSVLLATVIASLGLVGCVGQLDDMGGGTTQPRSGWRRHESEPHAELAWPR